MYVCMQSDGAASAEKLPELTEAEFPAESETERGVDSRETLQRLFALHLEARHPRVCSVVAGFIATTSGLWSTHLVCRHEDGGRRVRDGAVGRQLDSSSVVHTRHEIELINLHVMTERRQTSSTIHRTNKNSQRACFDGVWIRRAQPDFFTRSLGCIFCPTLGRQEQCTPITPRGAPFETKRGSTQLRFSIPLLHQGHNLHSLGVLKGGAVNKCESRLTSECPRDAGS